MPAAYGSCITRQLMGARPRYEAIMALGKIGKLTADKTEKVGKLMRKTFDVQEDRNRIIHDAWFGEKETGQPAQFKSFSWKDARYGIHDVERSFVEQTIAKIKQLRQDAVNLRHDIAAGRQP